jgi:predicted ATPase
LDSQELGHLIFKKTQGNPFFVNQFLHMLYNNKHIQFVEETTATQKDGLTNTTDNYSRSIGGWVCDTLAIKNANYTSNVVDMMVANLRKLPTSVQHLLGSAATFGNQFEVMPLAIICHKHRREIVAELSSVLKYIFRPPTLQRSQHNHNTRNTITTLATQSQHYRNTSIFQWSFYVEKGY